MVTCARAAPALLLQLNVLLAAYGGAALATAARLKWDASTYIALRELFPDEYRVAAAALCAAGLALLSLAHLAALAVGSGAPRTRRALLLLYACATAAALLGELALCAWLARRVTAWLHSPAAAQLLEALELRAHVRPLLDYFGRWHPLPGHISALVEEAMRDAPSNGYVALALVALLALLQPAAVVLAALAARSARLADRQAPRRRTGSYSWSSTDNEQAPLRTAYRNGRIVVL